MYMCVHLCAWFVRACVCNLEGAGVRCVYIHVCVCACMCNLVHLLHMTYCTPHGGSSRFGCLFMLTLWSHCYDNLLSI